MSDPGHSEAVPNRAIRKTLFLFFTEQALRTLETTAESNTNARVAGSCTLYRVSWNLLDSEAKYGSRPAAAGRSVSIVRRQVDEGRSHSSGFFL